MALMALVAQVALVALVAMAMLAILAMPMAVPMSQVSRWARPAGVLGCFLRS